MNIKLSTTDKARKAKEARNTSTTITATADAESITINPSRISSRTLIATLTTWVEAPLSKLEGARPARPTYAP